MQQFQVPAVPSIQRSFLAQLARDFRAALNYLSFYSSDSPFVVGAIRKLHKDLQRLLNTVSPLALYRQDGSVFVNGSPLNDVGDLVKVLEEKQWEAVLIDNGLSYNEWVSWLRHMAFPFEKDQEPTVPWEHLRKVELAELLLETPLEAESPMEVPKVTPVAQVEIPAESGAQPPSPASEEDRIQVEETFSPESLQPNLSAAQMDEAAVPPFPDTVPVGPADGALSEALLASVAEAWQFLRLLKRTPGEKEKTGLDQAFSQFFGHLLDRLETLSPGLKGIAQWFRTSQGEVVDNDAVLSMVPLVETAIAQGWTKILFDPATEGLVNDCLGLWGAQGKHELVEKAVEALAEGLGHGEAERRLALTHLMDARPWVDNPPLLGKVLDRLCHLLASEKSPGLYQSALLSAWDLVEPALVTHHEDSALSLLSTLHFHADDDEPAPEFPERASIARHWLFERSNPDLIRRMAACAYRVGRLDHFPLLGEMAAPLILDDYLAATPEEKETADGVFREIGDPIRSVLAQRVAALEAPEELLPLLPVIQSAGMDLGLAFQLSPWFSRGDREFKLNLIGLIDRIGNPEGGPALRMALFDDSEEIASEAAKALGHIGFSQAVPVLMKAARLRQGRGPDHERFSVEVCRALGELGSEEAIPFLEEIARKKALFRGRPSPLKVRLAAIEALARIDRPAVWGFFETLASEKNPELQKTLDRIIHEKTAAGL